MFSTAALLHRAAASGFFPHQESKVESKGCGFIISVLSGEMKKIKAKRPSRGVGLMQYACLPGLRLSARKLLLGHLWRNDSEEGRKERREGRKGEREEGGREERKQGRKEGRKGRVEGRMGRMEEERGKKGGRKEEKNGGSDGGREEGQSG